MAKKVRCPSCGRLFRQFGSCSACHEPDPTPEEIARLAAEIRAEWPDGVEPGHGRAGKDREEYRPYIARTHTLALRQIGRR
jgi:hypothetical protein